MRLMLEVVAACLLAGLFMLVLLEATESGWPGRAWRWAKETRVVRWLDERGEA